MTDTLLTHPLLKYSDLEVFYWMECEFRYVKGQESFNSPSMVMKMKRFALYILIAFFSVLLSECTNKVYKENSYYNLTNNKLDSKESLAAQEEQENIMI